MKKVEIDLAMRIKKVGGDHSIRVKKVEIDLAKRMKKWLLFSRRRRILTRQD